MLITIEASEGRRISEEHLTLGGPELSAALAKLDGKRTSLLTVTVTGNELFIGGGAIGYTVTALMNDGRSFALVGDDRTTGEVEMMIGGQMVNQAMRYVVDRARALKVATRFALKAELDDDEAWEEP